MQKSLSTEMVMNTRNKYKVRIQSFAESKGVINPLNGLISGTDSPLEFMDLYGERDHDIISRKWFDSLEAFIDSGSGAFSHNSTHTLNSIDMGVITTPNLMDSDRKMDRLSGDITGYFHVNKNMTDALSIQEVKISAFVRCQTDVSIEIASEKRNIHQIYAIEHSTNAKDWNHLGHIEIYDEESSILKHKQVPRGTNYYRAKYDDNTETTHTEIELVKVKMKQQKVEISPNPSSGQFTVSGLVGKNEISVFDQLGRLVRDLNSTAEDEILIDLSDLEKGSYFLHIKNDHQTFIRNIQKI